MCPGYTQPVQTSGHNRFTMCGPQVMRHDAWDQRATES